MAFQAEETVGVQAQRQDCPWSNGEEKQLGRLVCQLRTGA